MQIKELEETLGTELFERSARQIRLTGFGEDFAVLLGLGSGSLPVGILGKSFPPCLGGIAILILEDIDEGILGLGLVLWSPVGDRCQPMSLEDLVRVIAEPGVQIIQLVFVCDVDAQLVQL